VGHVKTSLVTFHDGGGTMSILPYRQSERRRKREALDQTRIVRAALALLDEVGLDDLTMRRLADRLNVKAASLYRHVRNKDELLMLLGDEISGEIPLVRPSGSWQNQLKEMARNVRQGLLAHRDAARLLAITPPFGPRRLRHVESVLRTLRASGLTDRDAASAAYHCNNFVTEFAADEARFASMALSTGGNRRKMFDEARKHFKSLPVEEYPTIVALADYLTKDDSDALFEFGLDMYIRGLHSLSKHRA